jgi:hypothetical protein
VSELLASHPSLNVALGLSLRDARAVLDHGAELNLVLDRRQVEVGHKAPSLLRVLPVTILARDRVGAFAAWKPNMTFSLESERPKAVRTAQSSRFATLLLRLFGHDYFVYLATITSSIWPRSRIMQYLKWSRLSEQIFRIDKWSLCQG